VLFNFYKEVGRGMMVSAAYYLTVTDSVGSGLEVNRDVPLAPTVAFQTFASVAFRLELSNFDDPRVALATAIFQGVLEVVLRCTAPERGMWTKRHLHKLATACRGEKSRDRRATALVVVHPAPMSSAQSRPGKAERTFIELARQGLQPTPVRIAEEHERRAVILRFNARMILLDMFGEYSGILIGSLILFMGQHNVMRYPFRPYRMHPNLFDGGNFYGELLAGTVVQMVIEVVTDTVCLLYEGRRGLDPLAVWRDLPRGALFPVVFAGMLYSTLAGTLRTAYGDSLVKCVHTDMCGCVGRGLLPGGVREAYCMMIYANTSGLPLG
jgi:hypothetical protein